MNQRIIVRIKDTEKGKIEQRIKEEYPKIKNVSELVRAALNSYLATTSRVLSPTCADSAQVKSVLKNIGEEPCKTASI